MIFLIFLYNMWISINMKILIQYIFNVNYFFTIIIILLHSINLKLALQLNYQCIQSVKTNINSTVLIVRLLEF